LLLTEVPILQERILCGGVTKDHTRPIGIEPHDVGSRIRYRRRGDDGICDLHVGAAVDCTGIVKDPRATPNPAVRSLFDQGKARVDPLCIGIETTDGSCAIVNRDGVPSRRLVAVSPLTRAAFWEIIAFPISATNAPSSQPGSPAPLRSHSSNST
jgi:uncharacterized NAD(P)/FAD-binding protein YdhS